MGCCITRRRTGSAPPSAGYRLGTRIQTAQVSGVTDVHPRLDLRRHTQWQAVQASRGAAYNWSGIDSLVSALNANNTDCLGVISQTPAWASSTGTAGNFYPNPADLPLLYDFVTALVTRYKGTIKNWEVYNEPNIRGWTAAQVAEVAIGCSARIHAADPNAVVVTGVTSVPPITRGGSSAATMWNSLLANPAFLAASDVLSWHLYVKGVTANPTAPPPEVGDNKGAVDDITSASIAKARAAGFTGPIWVTESGWNTDDIANPNNLVTNDNQANYLVRLAVMYAALGISRFFQFQLYGANTVNDEAGGMGLWEPPRKGGGKKPSWSAFQTACNFLIGATSVTDRSTTPGVYLYSMIKSDGKPAWCAWTVAGNGDAVIGGLPASVRKTLRDGTSSTVSTTSGALTVTAGPSPIWIDY